MIRRTSDRSEWARSRVHYGFLPALVSWVLAVSSPRLAHRFITVFGLACSAIVTAGSFLIRQIIANHAPQ